MPNQIDALRIGKRAGVSLPSISLVILLAYVLGMVAFFWAYLHVTYQTGFESARCMGPAVWAFGREPWTKLGATLAFPRSPDVGGSVAYLFGIVITLLLASMRARFRWWPFHPAGYLLVGSLGPLRIWFPVFVTWLIKGGILRYGGHRLYQQALPFFIGLILGEFSAGLLRTLIDLAFTLYLPPASGLGGL